MNESPYIPSEAAPEASQSKSFIEPAILGASVIALSLFLFFFQAWLNHSSVSYVKATVAGPQQTDYVHALRETPDFTGEVISLYVLGMICLAWNFISYIKRQAHSSTTHLANGQ